MAIEDFECEDDSIEAKVERPQIDNDAKARPYVSREVHERVNLFSANSGLPMQMTYDTLLNKAVTNTDILELILTSDNKYHDDLNDSELELLSEIADKCNELGKFPTRQEINQDDNLNGFPIYITYLGERERIKALVNARFSDHLDFELEV